MAYTQTQIDKLEAAMAKGVTSVRIGNEEVKFRSLEEMERQLARMKAAVAGSARVAPVRQLRPRLVRGL